MLSLLGLLDLRKLRFAWFAKIAPGSHAREARSLARGTRFARICPLEQIWENNIFLWKPKFAYKGILIEKLLLVWFSKNSPTYGDFEFFLERPKFAQTFKLIRLLTRIKRYTVWVYIESWIIHIRFWADLRYLKVIPPFLPSFLHDQ